jgi:hypothetical protein
MHRNMRNVRRFAKFILPDYTFNDKNVYFTKCRILLSIDRTIKNNDKNNYPSDNYKAYSNNEIVCSLMILFMQQQSDDSV